MAYEFVGFFARADGAVLDHALHTWPSCRGRLITVPFGGIGVAAPDRLHADTREAADNAKAVALALEKDLPAWGQQYPALRFVFLRAECFAGLCDYDGYVSQDGQILLHALGNSHSDALRRLMHHLDLELDDRSYFAPLQRHFFDG